MRFIPLPKPWRNLGEAIASACTRWAKAGTSGCADPFWSSANGHRLDAGLPGRQGRLLFAYLVLNRSRGCPRDELIDVLWPEGPPAAADSALSALLSKLRRALGEGVLTGRGELRLHLEGAVEVDIESSAAAILEAEAAMEAGDHALAARARPRGAGDRPADVPARRRGRLGGRAAARAGDDPAARAGDARRGGAAPGRARARRGRAGRRARRSPPRRSASPRTGC